MKVLFWAGRYNDDYLGSIVQIMAIKILSTIHGGLYIEHTALCTYILYLMIETFVVHCECSLNMKRYTRDPKLIIFELETISRFELTM